MKSYKTYLSFWLLWKYQTKFGSNKETFTNEIYTRYSRNKYKNSENKHRNVPFIGNNNDLLFDQINMG